MLHLSPAVQRLIDQALEEDHTFHDITTAALIPDAEQAQGIIRAKAPGVVAGLPVALAVFQRVDAKLATTTLADEGSPIEPGQPLAKVRGSAASILRAERTALNFLQRMSGIATETRRYVDAVRGLKARIVDTRKTVPGWRLLDKYAVTMGGGFNHRLSLADGVLIKDNHIAAMKAQGYSLQDVVRLALEKAPHTAKVEVEVTGLEEVKEALEAGAHVIMLDNMDLHSMRRAVKLVNGRAVVEASGGVSLETVRAIAETSVDLVSVGSLTHSPQALDISLDLEVA